MMTSRTPGPSPFFGSHIRLWDSLDPKVRDEVESEFAQRLETATPWRRVSLQRQMRREIERRLGESTSNDARN
ncbi:MAG: hypothetical protein KDA61_03145 [Planctomycetales bacterium]|nr:hypothetical protein [Planctomycetales bacterium]